jgi:anti-sigma regulatory factor (Ser/Thr protein kinase)
VIEMHPGTCPARTPDLGSSLDDCPYGAIPWRFRQSFPGTADQVAATRRFVSRALAGCRAVADAVLLTSELATNAVQHSASGQGGNLAVVISHVQDRVRVAVSDNGSASHPTVATEDGLATSGRGLILVDALADRWGYAGGPAPTGQVPGGPAPAGPAATGPKHEAGLNGEHPGGLVWFELRCR